MDFGQFHVRNNNNSFNNLNNFKNNVANTMNMNVGNQ